MAEAFFHACLHILLVQAARHQQNLPQMACMSYMYLHGECEALDVAHAAGISKSSIYRIMHGLEACGAVRKSSVRKDNYRQKIELWALTETGKRTVREWERRYRMQVHHLASDSID